MVRSITLGACVLMISFGAIAAEKKPAAAPQEPAPESIAAEAAEVSSVGGVVGEADDGMSRLEDEMNEGENQDGCTGAIGNEDNLLGCN